VVWIGLIWLLEGSCEHGNERQDSVKLLDILVNLSGWWLLKKDSALRSLVGAVSEPLYSVFKFNFLWSENTCILVSHWYAPRAAQYVQDKRREPVLSVLPIRGNSQDNNIKPYSPMQSDQRLCRYWNMDNYKNGIKFTAIDSWWSLYINGLIYDASSDWMSSRCLGMEHLLWSSESDDCIQRHNKSFVNTLWDSLKLP
jgi:hypothetical protein